MGTGAVPLRLFVCVGVTFAGTIALRQVSPPPHSSVTAICVEVRVYVRVALRHVAPATHAMSLCCFVCTCCFVLLFLMFSLFVC